MEHAFGPYLKQLREQQSYSINQLAEAAGISNSQISRIENGVRGVPKPATIRKLADALSVPYADMMKQAGYIETANAASEAQDIPEWATYKDRRDFKKMLEDEDDLMFDGIPLDDEDKTYQGCADRTVLGSQTDEQTQENDEPDSRQ